MIQSLRNIFSSGKPRTMRLVPYRSYGTGSHLYLLGRALYNEKLKMLKDQSFFHTIKNTYKQFESDEIPHIRVALKIPDGPVLEAKTGEEGYFLFSKITTFNLKALADKEGWARFEVSFLEQTQGSKILADNRFEAELLIPRATSTFGIISDIDDTIMHTGVNSFLKWRVAHNSLFKNAHKRVFLKGAPEFYRLLHRGKSGKEQNPVFYLSNSPWNLYQYLRIFLDINDFPKGPILLRDFSSPFGRKPEKPHKQKEMINLLNTYPHLNFILIGDSGEHDPRIYTDIALKYPDRILAIYLRSVKHKRRMRKVREMVENFTKVPVLSVETSAEAEIHAREHGFI
ncbi:MAG TPA: phosphatase domain-containing protein [Salinimicrobium sp.]|nr:phosphatase domain-containing protein [Salinimicrobium sp.]